MKGKKGKPSLERNFLYISVFLGKPQHKKERRKRNEGRKERQERKERKERKESQRKKKGKKGKQTLENIFCLFVCYWAKNNPTFLSQTSWKSSFEILKNPIFIVVWDKKDKH